MSRTIAISLLLIGMLLFLGSCAPMGMVIYYEMIISPSDSYSLSGPNTVDKTTFHASPGTLARFTITADITTPSVQEDSDSLDDKYLARFKFPISYTISDASDKILVKEATVLAWRDKDPYLNDMGREAANFQLTMLVYYLISFVLCFVLRRHDLSSKLYHHRRNTNFPRGRLPLSNDYPFY